MTDINKELDVWFPENKMTLKSGKIIDLPKLNWGREMRAMKIVLSIINQTPELKTLIQPGQTFDTTKLIILLPKWLEQFSDKVSELVGILTNIAPKDIDETFETEDIFNVLSRFFKRSAAMIRGISGPTVAVEAKTPSQP